jgi:ABC-type nitrate/sulfonate/bicarbonate transport system substrate-binding protein
MTIDTLWYSYCPGPNAVGIASHLGWLADEFGPDGITVRTLASSPAPERQVRDAHQLVPQPELFPYLLRHGGNPPPLVALSRGVDVRIVGLTWTESTRRVLALEDSDIGGPADLKGRRLAVPRREGVAVDYVRSVTLRTYSEALASAGLTFYDVELVEIPGGPWGRSDVERRGGGEIPYTQGIGSAAGNAATHREEAVALLRGEVDAIAGEHAQVAHIQATLRLRTVFDTQLLPDATRRSSGDQPLVLTATGALLEERPDIVARWIARSLEAAEWAIEHPAQARRVAAVDVGLAEGFVIDAYSPEVHEQLAIDLDQRSIDGLRAQYEHLLAHGFLAGAYDVEEFIDPAPLATAKELRASRSAAVASA